MITKLISLNVSGAYRIESNSYIDNRGFFTSPLRSEYPHQVNRNYTDIYISHNLNKYTLRGFHYQRVPSSESKIVTAVRGSALHVILNVTSDGQVSYDSNILDHPSVSSFVPSSAASAFLTLEPDTTILYLSDTPYSAECSCGYLWDDPTINYPWPVSMDQLTISDRDLSFKLI